MLESRVMDVLRTIIDDPRTLSEIFEEAQAQQLTNSKVSDAARMQIQQAISDNEKKLNRILAAIKELGHSRALLIELTLAEAKQAELQTQIAQTEVMPKVIPILLADIVSNIQRALDMADEKQRATIVRGFVTKVVAQSVNGIVSGRIHAEIAGAEIIVPL